VSERGMVKVRFICSKSFFGGGINVWLSFRTWMAPFRTKHGEASGQHWEFLLG